MATTLQTKDAEGPSNRAKKNDSDEEELERRLQSQIKDIDTKITNASINSNLKPDIQSRKYQAK